MRNLTDLSRTLAHMLRHDPAAYKLEMEQGGWVETSQVLRAFKAKGQNVTIEILRTIVTPLDPKEKIRYVFNADESKIRASQGHSIDVGIKFNEAQPPKVLYHGTTQNALDSIMRSGLNKQKRHHVHMSADIATAKSVGDRYSGKTVILAIDTAAMQRDGYVFLLSENNVWLIDNVPHKYLSIVSDNN